MFRFTPRRIAAGFCLTIAACAPGVTHDDLAFAQPAPSAEPILIVENQYLSTASVYALLGGTRLKLGAVQPGETTQMRIPRAVMDRPDLQLQVEPMERNGSYTFPSVVIMPGSTIALKIANTLNMSTILPGR